MEIVFFDSLIPRPPSQNAYSSHHLTPTKHTFTHITLQTFHAARDSWAWKSLIQDNSMLTPT